MTVKEMRNELLIICKTFSTCDKCSIFVPCFTHGSCVPEHMPNAEIKRVYAAYQKQKEETT